MIIDSLIEFGEVDLKTGGTCPGFIDAHKSGDAIGGELYLHVVSCGGVPPAGGTGVKVELETADDEEFSEGITKLMVLDVPVKHDRIQHASRMPLGCKRYLRAKATPKGSFSAGKVDVFLADKPQHSYQDLD